MAKLTDQPGAASHPPLVLIVDDDSPARFLLRTLLTREGYAVAEAENGSQALSIYESMRPDLVLLDGMMPVMDGFTTCSHLRALPGGERIPVLLVTALDDEEAVDRAFAVGATDYVIKPIHKAVLRQRVRRLLQARQAEEALQEKTAELQAVFEAIPDLFFRLSPDGIILNYYSGSTLNLALSPAAFIGKSIQEVLPAQAASLIGEAVAQVCQSNKPYQIEYALPLEVGEQTFEAFFWPFFNGEVIVLVHNITDRKQMEDQILAAQKLADLGTLAAGIAHEINSPLQVITGISQSLLNHLEQNLPEPAALRQKLELIRRNGWRCAEIVRSLSTYAYAAATQLEPHDLNALVKDALLLIEHQLKSWSNISIVTTLTPDLPPLVCDRNQITQVLINLLTNARDAMPETGKITIHTGYNPETARLALRVSDTGCGIPASIQPRIFDPFFTTKVVGKGTGLGLSIVAGIVNACGGEIQVDSIAEQGATFSLFFPVTAPTTPVNSLQLNVTGRFDEIIHLTANTDGHHVLA